MISSCWLISFIHFLADQQGLDPWMNEWDLRRRKDTLISPLVCSNGYEKMANTDWFLGMPSAVVITSFIHFHFRFFVLSFCQNKCGMQKMKTFSRVDSCQFRIWFEGWGPLTNCFSWDSSSRIATVVANILANNWTFPFFKPILDILRRREDFRVSWFLHFMEVSQRWW